MALTPRLSIPDDLYLFYETEASARERPLEDSLVYRLHAGVGLHPDERTLVLTGADLIALESTLGGGHLLSSTDLIHKVERLGRVEFGRHKIELTVGQMEEIAHRARHNNRTIEEALSEIWRRFSSEFFRYV